MEYAAFSIYSVLRMCDLGLFTGRRKQFGKGTNRGFVPFAYHNDSGTVEQLHRQ